MSTLTVTTEYSYQAWQQAHRELRSNVEVVDAVEHGDSVTVTFRTVDTERWPVAAKHYREQVSWYLRRAQDARRRGDLVGAAMHLESARVNRVNLVDAKHGTVTDVHTLRPFSV